MAENSEIKVDLVHIGRCSKTVKGGRKLSFAAIVIAGDQKGKVGFGHGKAAEVMDAKEKAENEAKKSMVKIPLREGRTLHHDISGRHGSGYVIMRAAPAGTGIIAGGPIRALCKALGVKDIVVKSVGSSNPHNMIKAAINAFKLTKSPRYIADKRDMKVGEIITKRERALGGKQINPASRDVEETAS